MISARALNILFGAAILVYLGYSAARPQIARYLWGEPYKEMMFQCDHGMREHYIAKKAVEFSPSKQSVKNLQASELGLLQCHDYDKTRKKLISWGLDDNDLSLLGIEALEEKEYELYRFVQIHEFRY